MFHKTVGIEKIYGQEGGGGSITIFGLKFFCFTVPKVFVGEPFNVSLISGIEKFLCLRGLCHDFSSV